MGTLLYVCGPSCSGKTSLATRLLKHLPEYVYVRGDDFWISHDQPDFRERVAVTEESIRAHIDSDPSEHILLEWIPDHGDFVFSLQQVCQRRNREFWRIVLNARTETLQRRKELRDGDTDTMSIRAGSAWEDATTLMIDTTKLRPDDVLTETLQFLRMSGAI